MVRLSESDAPAAAGPPPPNPKKIPMPAFLAKLTNANPNQICTAQAPHVRTVNVDWVLRQRLRIPVFQRRYCWNVPQWRTLFNDAFQLLSSSEDGSDAVHGGVLGATSRRQRHHRLGRLTCALEKDNEPPRHRNGSVDNVSTKPLRVLVIDGQQRNITTILLLAAIRDVVRARQGGCCDSSGGDGAIASELADAINALLFPEEEGLAAWQSEQMVLEQSGGQHDSQGAASASDQRRTPCEGEALDFAVLVPTYCDRASFFGAILPQEPRLCCTVEQSEHSTTRPSRTAASSGGGTRPDLFATWQRPLEAKRWFLAEIVSRKLSLADLANLQQAILQGFEWLFFPLDMRGRDDGTEDLQVVYERLALRDAIFCRPQRSSEFADMGSADFIRNFLLGGFASEAASVALYKRYWVPIEERGFERAVAVAETGSAKEGAGANVGEVLESTFGAFLAAQPESFSAEAAHGVGGPGVGGLLYARFRSWVMAASESESVLVGLFNDLDARERCIVSILERLHDFSMAFLATSGASGGGSGSLGLSQSNRAVATARRRPTGSLGQPAIQEAS